jgi:dienelactone hydrolase
VDGLPSTLEHIPLEYFDVAIEWLRQHASVDPDQIAVLGSSRGAEAVLLVASRNDDIRRVIAASPSGIVWRGFDSANPPDSDAAWSLGGNDLPYVLPDAAVLSEGRIGAAYQAALDSAYRRPEVQIEVENINGPILLISGREDQQWPSAEMAEKLVERLERSGFPFAIEHKSYPDAGHLAFIGNPNNAGLPDPAVAWSPMMGGTEAGNRAAWADSWSQVLRFLAEPSGSDR